MKKETLAEAIGNVEDRLIKEAEGKEAQELPGSIGGRESLEEQELPGRDEEMEKLGGREARGGNGRDGAARKIWFWRRAAATAAAVLLVVAAGGYLLRGDLGGDGSIGGNTEDSAPGGAGGASIAGGVGGDTEDSAPGEAGAGMAGGAGDGEEIAEGAGGETTAGGGLTAAYGDQLVAEAMSLEKVPADDFERLYELREENPVEEDFYEALQEFAFRTAAALAAEKTSGEQLGNIVYSPFSLYYALALTAQGAEGETQEELLRLLGGESSAGWLSGQCGNLYRTLYRDNDQGNFRIANSVWMAQERDGQALHYEEPFLKTVTEDFYSSLFAADFMDPETGKAMGAWVAEQTGGLLQPDFPANADRIVEIINTIYLKDEWVEPFMEPQTASDVFRRADGSEAEVDFMNRVDFRTAWVGEGFTRAALGLKQTGEMVFVLPDEGVSVEELLASPERLREAFEGGGEVFGEVTWKVPKFTFGMEGTLVEMLKSLGVEQAFDQARADFSGMVDWQVYVSEVRQGAKLSVNENGVEAAAFTEVGMDTGGVLPDEMEKVQMVLDRPFLYAVYTGGNITFFGVCGDPSLEE